LVVTIQFANTSQDAFLGPQKDFYYQTSKKLPDYLKTPQTQYNPVISTPDDDSLDAILNSKRDLLIDKLAMLTHALDERKKITIDLFQNIQKDSTWCQNQIFEIEKLYDPKLEREWKRNMLDLNRERRQERTAYFRDVSMIQQELRDTMLEYIKERQMDAL
jgi:hypothetical protein